MKKREMTLSHKISRDWKMNKYKYLLILPVLVYLALFCYKPMYGLIIAFNNYKPTRGITGSDYVGLMWFDNFFNNIYFWRLLSNTFTISALSIVFGFPAPIILALLLNEIQNDKFKRTVQTITYMPYFISLVVTCSIIKIYCQENGLFSQIIEIFGGTRRNLLIDPSAYRPIYVLSGIWQNIGWNSIIYLAALTSIDPGLHEAAMIDGAGKLRRIWHIDLPGIGETIAIMLILKFGSMMSTGFEKIYSMQADLNLSVSEVISTYVYKMGMMNNKYSYSAAISLFNNVINFILLILVNKASSKLSGSSLW